MKLRKTLAGILGAVVMLLGVGTFEHVNGHFNGYIEVHAANEPVTVEKSSFTNLADTFDGGVASYTTAKGGGTSNPAVNNNQIRLYQNASGNPGGNITITVPSPYELVSVTIGSGMATKISYAIGTGDITTTTYSIANGGKYTINDINNSSVTIHCMGTDKNSRLYVNYLSVTYVSTAASDCEHKNTSKETTPATCTEKGSVVETCNDCSAIVSRSEIDATGHNFENGVCKNGCGLDAISGVKKLFSDYYNDNQYLKETVLNITEDAILDVSTYFHANASVKERETWYYGDTENGTSSLTMYTNEDTNGDGIEENVVSTYENKDGKVYHTGKGGNWSVNWNSVEEKFVTLKDFKDSTDTNWVCDDNQKVFTYILTPATANSEHEMTRMAREFVAPMWLAPNADNYNYVRFTKLTVEENTGIVNPGLVMKLYADTVNSGITDDNKVFAQATINKVYDITIETDVNCSVDIDPSVIAANSSVNYSINVAEGYDLVLSDVKNATATLSGTNGISVSNASGDVTIKLTTKVATNEKTSTISFASTDQRTVFSSTQQVWSDGNVTLTNNKSSSNTPVADYSNPARFYASSEIIINRTGMTKIVFNCNTNAYATALKNSIGDAATADGKVVTVEFENSTDNFTIEKLSGQIRMDSIVVYYSL